MAENFYSILTSAGLAKLANAQVTGKKVDLTEIAVGDGGGTYYNPTQNDIQLRNEVWRGNIGSVEIDSENPNWIVIESYIPATQGGFTVREVGIFDDAGDLIAIGKYPETYKPSLDDGATKDLLLRMIIEVTNASAVTMKVDPSVIIASRKYVDEKVGVVSNNLMQLQQEFMSHSADNVKHITAEERTAWNNAEANAKAYTDTAPEPMQRNFGIFNVYKSGKDSSGIFTTVEYKRADGTLYMKSVLSNPDANGNYQTQTITYYDTDGTTVLKSDPYTITYDADGDVVSEVKS